MNTDKNETKPIDDPFMPKAPALNGANGTKPEAAWGNDSGGSPGDGRSPDTAIDPDKIDDGVNTRPMVQLLAAVISLGYLTIDPNALDEDIYIGTSAPLRYTPWSKLAKAIKAFVERWGRVPRLDGKGEEYQNVVNDVVAAEPDMPGNDRDVMRRAMRKALDQVSDQASVWDDLDEELRGPIFDRIREGVNNRRTNRAVRAAADAVDRGDFDGAREAMAKASAPITGDTIPLVTIAEVEMRPINWLWRGYIPQGVVVLIVGDPDSGKTLVTHDLAARITRGGSFPDGSKAETGDVIIISNEDAIEYTIRPRLEAAGADTRRVRALPLGSRFTLTKDVARLEAVTTATTRLVIIDPMSAYLPKIDTYRDNEVRTTLDPLVTFASRSGAAVVGIMHLNKNNERIAIQRINSSIAFTALSRGTYLVVRDADNSARRLFLPIKMNLGPLPPGLAFRPTGTIVGDDIETVRAVWEQGRVALTSDEALRKLTKAGTPAQQRERVIRSGLADGPRTVTEMEALALSNGITDRTAGRVRERLGIESVRDPADPMGGAYYWLPPDWTLAQRDAWKAERRSRRAALAAKG